ncbi:MAG: hypothetical protein HY914_04615 [Desulfomonile tiedjei]|nr:hypothetical protein [Desulfomonile tiedjei]
MRSNPLKRLTVLLLALVFCLVCGLSFAAEKQWVVIKDSKGKCSVRSTTKGKTEKTIEGPFATKEEAQKAKAVACPKPEKKK